MNGRLILAAVSAVALAAPAFAATPSTSAMHTHHPASQQSMAANDSTTTATKPAGKAATGSHHMSGTHHMSSSHHMSSTHHGSMSGMHHMSSKGMRSGDMSADDLNAESLKAAQTGTPFMAGGGGAPAAPAPAPMPAGKSK